MKKMIKNDLNGVNIWQNWIKNAENLSKIKIMLQYT